MLVINVNGLSAARCTCTETKETETVRRATAPSFIFAVVVVRCVIVGDCQLRAIRRKLLRTIDPRLKVRCEVVGVVCEIETVIRWGCQLEGGIREIGQRLAAQA